MNIKHNKEYVDVYIPCFIFGEGAGEGGSFPNNHLEEEEKRASLPLPQS